MSSSVDRLPRVVSITAGGAGMFCGSCMRDNAVAAAAHRLGVPITLVPTFTPITTDEEDVSSDDVWLGGINVYLDQKWPVLGRLPRAVRRALDHPRLLRAVSKRALQTRRRDDGALAISLLQGLEGRQRSSTRALIDTLVDDHCPEVVNVTNLLVAGFVPGLKQRLEVPVVATLQGDDIFLDTLSPADRQQALVEMRRIARHVDAFVVFSRDYRDRMAALFEIPHERMHVLPLGVASPEAFYAEERAARRHGTASLMRPPTLGYLARLCPEKGFHHLVDAFLEIRRRPATARARLVFGGWLGALDRDFFERQMDKIDSAGARDAVTRLDLPDRPSKIELLQQIDVFSVPSEYREPKGLYVLEALAAGVPVVQPEHGAFPELMASTGGGVLVPPGQPMALADAVYQLLLDPERRRRLGLRGRLAVVERHSADAMARASLDLWQRLAFETR